MKSAAVASPVGLDSVEARNDRDLRSFSVCPDELWRPDRTASGAERGHFYCCTRGRGRGGLTLPPVPSEETTLSKPPRPGRYTAQPATRDSGNAHERPTASATSPLYNGPHGHDNP